MRQILLVAPDHDLAGALGRALAGVKSQGSAALLREYPSPGQLAKMVHLKRPSLVIVSLKDPELSLGLIQNLVGSYPTLSVVAAHTVNDSALILAAVRAGAAEYLGPPFEREHVERVLVRPPRNQNQNSATGKLIAFLPARAGCGASTAALHTADSLARQSGKRVLVVDYDFHSGSLDFCLRLKPDFTLGHALKRSADLEEIWGGLPCRWKGLELVASPRLYGTEPEDLGEAGAVFRFALSRYEWVVADFPAAVFASCREVLTQAAAVYLLSTPELVSLHLAKRRAQELYDLGIPRENVQLVLSRADAKNGCSAKDVAKLVGLPVVWSLSNEYKALSRAHQAGALVRPDSRLGREFHGLARRILGVPAAAAVRDWKLSWKHLFSFSRPEVLSPVPR